MKKAMFVGLLSLFALAGCGRDEADTSSSSSAAGATGNAPGAQLPPGDAAAPGANKADQNTTDQVPTQQQLDPVPAEGSKAP